MGVIGKDLEVWLCCAIRGWALGFQNPPAISSALCLLLTDQDMSSQSFLLPCLPLAIKDSNTLKLHTQLGCRLL